MKKLLIISGPTATGKTALGIKLAEKFEGEIVSADSRQIYRGMDIGTGKDLPEKAISAIKNEILQIKIQDRQKLKPYRFQEIPVWLLDIVNPDETFTVAQYTKLAWQVIDDVWKRGKLPVLVGGNGFYIKAVTSGIETLGIPPDWQLRKKLENYQTADLQKQLSEIWPEKIREMNESDRQNPRRLIRAIEIAGRKIENGKWRIEKREQAAILTIGLTASRKIIYSRIDKRVDERVKTGITEEIENLLKHGYFWDLPAMSALGYRQLRLYFEKKANLEEAVQKWKFAEHGYARRQLTWFKKDKKIHWFEITDSFFEEKVEKFIRRWYHGN